MADFRCFARVAPIANLQALARVASHGRRLDPSARTRVDPDRTPLNLAFSAYRPDDPLDLVGAWRLATAEQAAVPYGRAPIGAHLLVGVTPAWIDERGSRHDPMNPANVALVREATAWAEDAFGAGSVIAGRLDVDEHGGGVVDLIVVPVRQARVNRHATKTIISLAKALTEIHGRHEDATSYGALQSSWAVWAIQHMDPRLQRGTPKTETAREHVHADVFRYVAAACEAELREKWDREVTAAQAEAEAELAAARAKAAALAEREAAVATFERDLETWRLALEQHDEECQAAVKLAVSESTRGVARGITAFRDGSISLDETADGRIVVRFARLPVEEVADLESVLRPAWRVGLLNLLKELRHQGDPVTPVIAPR